MRIRITLESKDNPMSLRSDKWEQISQRKYELRPASLERSLALAVQHAEEEYGLSSDEATMLRHLKDQLAK